MKRTLLAASLLALVAVASAQTATLDPAPTALQSALERLGGTYVFDPLAKGKATLALTYRTATLTDFLGRKGLNIDIDALAGATGSTATLGTGLLFSKELKFTLSSNMKGLIDLQVGPALLYGSDGGKLHLGAVLGVGFKF